MMKDKINLKDLYKNKNIEDVEYSDIYIPLKEKMALAERILNACIKKDNDFVEFDYMAKDILVYLNAVVLYTNIVIDNDDFGMNAYDQLMYLNINLENCPFSADYERLKEIINNMMNNAEKHSTLEYILKTAISKIKVDSSKLTDSLIKLVDKTDPDTVVKYFSKIADKLVDKAPDLSNQEEVDKFIKKLNK